jgi:hypothetical protein
MEKSGGFDMSKMSMADKIVLGGGILLLLDSFLSWQKVCVSDILGGLGGGADFCGKANAWGGNGGFFGLLMGILVIVLIVWEVMQITGSTGNIKLPVSASKGTAYLGFGAAAFGLIKFILAVTNHGALFAYVGLILILGVAYGSWMKFQEPESSAPPAAASGGSDGGFSA